MVHGEAVRRLQFGLERSPVAAGRDGHDVGPAVRRNGQFEVVAGALFLKVGDELVRRVVFRVCPNVAVHLIHRLNRRARISTRQMSPAGRLWSARCSHRDRR